MTLTGRVIAISGQPLALAQIDPGPDREPNNSAACARLLAGEAHGRVDAATDPVDVFRLVAARDGSVTATLSAEAFAGDALLFDLSRGVAARTLDLEAGDVYDLVVVAGSGAGAYRVAFSGKEDRTPRELPMSYRHCGEGYAPGELIVAPPPGVSPEAIAAIAGLECLGGTERLCLLRAPEAEAAGEFAALCRLLSRCARLEAAGLVRYAEPNYYRRLAATPDDPLRSSQWGLDQVRAPAAWELIDSTNLIIAFVDSGVRQHPDVVDNLVPGWDFEEDDDDPDDPTPNFSHGTQVAGVLAAKGNNGIGVTGMLWNARLMPLRAFDSAGFGTAFDISNAILFAAGEPNESGTVPAELPTALNLSFASSIPTTAEEDACIAARAAGVFLCAAVGNSGTVSTRYPAGYDSVMAAAATTIDGDAASYSNFGNWIDISAPGGTSGNGVRVPGVVSGGGFGYPFVNGTSFSCPHVVAIATMCRSVATLTVDEVWQILISTARDIDSEGYDPRTGFGIVDAYHAVLAALGQTAPVLIPFEEVTVRLLRAGELSVLMSATTTQTEMLAFSFVGVPPGSYLLEAGTDRNLDGDITDAGEVFGRWQDGDGGDVLEVAGSLSGLDFTIQPR